ncbi:MAG: TlpA disulfide reductase family protein [Bryobacteraceae bacterium]
MKSLSLALLVASWMYLSAQESPNNAAQIEAQLKQLRQLPDAERGQVTRELALDIRRLPATSELKEPLAEQLANLVTEGDPGRQTLQEVATTLAQALQQHPVVSKRGETAEDYITLAQLARYEHVSVSLDDPRFAAATKKLEADDQSRQRADFTLTDLNGMKWNLRALAGKVVLVNFWATWCPPCRKELPDLEALYQRFGSRGFVILAISDEEAGKVAPFVAAHKLTYPVLLDPGRKVNELLQISGIPKSFVYDRKGKLAAEAIDMRTQRQFLEMLQRAGLE